MPEVIFPGPEGRLEGRYHPQKERDAPIAIVLHPHPFDALLKIVKPQLTIMVCLFLQDEDQFAEATYNVRQRCDPTDQLV